MTEFIGDSNAIDDPIDALEGETAGEEMYGEKNHSGSREVLLGSALCA